MSSKAGRELAMRRKKVEHTCPECGTEFVGYPQAITCSDACRARRSYRKRKQLKEQKA